MSILTILVVLYLAAYALAMTIWFNATGEWLSAFRVDRVVQECVGAVSRWTMGAPALRHDADPFDGLYCSEAASERDVLSRLNLREECMNAAPWAWTTSQCRAHAILAQRAIEACLAHRSKGPHAQQAAHERAYARQGDLPRGRSAEPQAANDWSEQLRRIAAAAHAHAARMRQEGCISGAAWRAELGVAANESDIARVKAAFRRKASEAHPDRGGSHEQMAAVNAAMAEARKELEFV